jgi:type VI secretion system protein ImpK
MEEQPRMASHRISGGHGTFESMLGRSINPLVSSASPLLVLATQLRSTATHSDVEGLRSYAVQLMKKFEAAVQSAGYAQEVVLTARYVLCVFVDEVVLGTPWGSESPWSADSLLSTFHNEVGGGEKFFILLERLAQNPATNVDLLELFYICLASGFRGKYGVEQTGLTRLNEIQGNLYRTILNQRGDFERDLSPHWVGVPDKRNVLERYVPFWVFGVLAGFLLLVLFLGFQMALHKRADPVVEGLEQLVKGEVTSTQTTADM